MGWVGCLTCGWLFIFRWSHLKSILWRWVTMMSQRLRQVTHDKTMDTCEMVQPVEMDAASSEQSEDSKLKMLFAAWPKSGQEARTARIIGYPFSTICWAREGGLPQLPALISDYTFATPTTIFRDGLGCIYKMYWNVINEDSNSYGLWSPRIGIRSLWLCFCIHLQLELHLFGSKMWQAKSAPGFKCDHHHRSSLIQLHLERSLPQKGMLDMIMILQVA